MVTVSAAVPDQPACCPVCPRSWIATQSTVTNVPGRPGTGERVPVSGLRNEIVKLLTVLFLTWTKTHPSI